ncbi:hypothetical protein LRAMOSA10610 [Lichtheimia ramosa]|uniref:DUF2421 domain-containing protein n=1 Tax=Lichtheimia ramosa TaxID=688394 RepID=A0A077WPC5_9FUNG|nr:hypothetical protein LRAMOSA10610 [Lichtheimia ramosa]
MGVAYIVATLFVVVPAISKVAPNSFWIGVSVVTVLDNTVGGFLSLSIQRMIGTIIGGGLSIIVMTISRAIYPEWEISATVLLCALMFCQVFIIARIKLRPNMNYAGGIGLLTTVVILLSGYQDLTHDKLSASAELAFWRGLDLVIGIVIAMLASLCIFPLKARYTMRKNLGESLEEAADLFERVTVYCLDLTKNDNHHLTETLKPPPPAKKDTTISIDALPLPRPPFPSQQINHDMEIWNHELFNDLCDKAFKVLTRLQTEATRLRSVSKEYYLQVPFRLLFGRGKERCRRVLRRTKQYSESIDAMKRIVWSLVSFRLLLPLLKLDDNQAAHDRMVPTQATLRNFQDSLWVMRRLGEMLKDTRRKLSEESEWTMIQWRVENGTIQIQRELLQTIEMSKSSESIDGLKLLSYYGFLVRCATIWQGLERVVQELGPKHRPLSTAPSSVSFPSASGDTLHAQE